MARKKQSKYVGHNLDWLKDFIKDIDKAEDPELHDEIKTLIAAKEFEEMAKKMNAQ